MTNTVAAVVDDGCSPHRDRRCAPQDDKSNGSDSSIVIAARPRWAAIARVGLPGLFGEEAALFAAAYTTMRPQTFQNHFSGGGCRADIFFVGNAEAVDMVHQVLDVCELLVAIGS